MEYNKSLSARIKRRNKQGFSGLGTGKMVIDGEVKSFNSVRASQMGDYTDPKQNNKNTEINHVANQARALSQIGRHKGSKPIKRLKRLIGQLDSRHYWEEKAKEALSNS